MIVSGIAFLIAAAILWSSGALGDMLHWGCTKVLPMVLFPFLFVSGLFWVTDRVTPGWAMVIAFVVALLYFLGGVIQLLYSIYHGHMLKISYSTMRDSYTNVPIKLRVRVFALVAIVLGGLGVWNPHVLQQVFIDHKAGLEWGQIWDRAATAGDPGPAIPRWKEDQAPAPAPPKPGRKVRG